MVPLQETPNHHASPGVHRVDLPRIDLFQVADGKMPKAESVNLNPKQESSEAKGIGKGKDTSTLRTQASRALQAVYGFVARKQDEHEYSGKLPSQFEMTEAVVGQNEASDDVKVERATGRPRRSAMRSKSPRRVESVRFAGEDVREFRYAWA